MNVINTSLNQAHKLIRKAERKVAEMSLDEAILNYEKSIECYEEAALSDHNGKMNESLELQIDQVKAAIVLTKHKQQEEILIAKLEELRKEEECKLEQIESQQSHEGVLYSSDDTSHYGNEDSRYIPQSHQYQCDADIDSMLPFLNTTQGSHQVDMQTLPKDANNIIEELKMKNKLLEEQVTGLMEKLSQKDAQMSQKDTQMMFCEEQLSAAYNKIDELMVKLEEKDAKLKAATQIQKQFNAQKSEQDQLLLAKNEVSDTRCDSESSCETDEEFMSSNTLMDRASLELPPLDNPKFDFEEFDLNTSSVLHKDKK